MAITIMFILLAVGLLFLRNALFHLQVTGVSNERIADLNYSRSGIDFVDHELMTSPLGADWRPQARNLNPGGMIAGLPADPALAALDPDFQYLRPWAPTDSNPVQVLVYKGQPVMRSLMGPTGGFTRISFGQGRALIRVTYNPRNAISFNGGSSPVNIGLPLSADLPAGAKLYARGPWMEYGPTGLSRYVRIDSIGRFGDTSPLDNMTPPYTDPTSIVNAGIDRPYRVQMVAYKAFGLGDHLLFVTNKEKEGGLFDIGYGSQAAFSSPAPFTLFDETPGSVAGDVGGQEFAGNIRINGSANWDRTDVSLVPSPLLVGYGVDIAGSTYGTLSLNGAGNLAQTTQSAPGGSLFAGDVVRDNNWFTDADASTARAVRRLQTPPLNLDRYRTLTRDSNGSGLYIRNGADMQPQIPAGAVHTGHDIDEAPQNWYNPYDKPPASSTDYWTNPGYIYSPPSVKMIFNHPLPSGTADPDPFTTKYYFIRLYAGTQSGIPGTQSGVPFLDVYYTPDAINDANLATYISNPPSGDIPARLVTDHTIMAEGNLSVQGDVAPGMTSAWWSAGLTESAQLSVVSRGTIYLTGSLTRAEDDGSTDQNPLNIENYQLGKLLVPSAAALLAEDHVALNLTQTGVRVQPWNTAQPDPNLQPNTDVPAVDPDIAAGGTVPPANHWTFDPNGGNDSGKYFRLTFDLPPLNAMTVDQNGNAITVQQAVNQFGIRLYLRSASYAVNTPQAPNQDTWVTAYINPTTIIQKAGAGTLIYPQQSITPLTQSRTGQDAWEYASYQLTQAEIGLLKFGGSNSIYVQVQGNTYYLSRAAIKIGSTTVPEAFINLEGAFLANEGSFYVIPKDWFFFNPATPIPPRQGDGPVPSGMPIDYSNGTPYTWSQDSTYPDKNPFTSAPAAPLLQQISISGSLTLNKMAPAGTQATWALYDPAPVKSPDGTVAPGPLYSFDDGLVDIAMRQGNWLPIMPSLPMVPGLVFEGEEGLL